MSTTVVKPTHPTAYVRRLEAIRTACAAFPVASREFRLLVALWIYRGGSLEGLPSTREIESLTTQLAEQLTGGTE